MHYYVKNRFVQLINCIQNAGHEMQEATIFNLYDMI